jgi:hypothetical protein
METGMNGGFLAIWHDVAPGGAAALTEWYNKEHHFERLRVPGFLRASRYEAADLGSRAYFVLYESLDPDVFNSPAYRDRLDHPTLWTRRVMPLYARMSRTACRLAYGCGLADGGAVAAIALRRAPDTMGSNAAKQALSSCFAMEGVTRCLMLEPAPAPTPSGPSAETHLRGRPDDTIAGAILINTNRAADARRALDAFQSRAPEYLADGVVAERGIYTMVFTLGAADLPPASTESGVTPIA